jgi:hypothetical protein
MTNLSYEYTRNWENVLPFPVLDVLRAFADLCWGYCSDSTLDEFNIELDELLDPEQHAINNEPLDDSDVERRNAAIVIDRASATRAHLSSFDYEVLHMIPNVWQVSDDFESSELFKRAIFCHLFNIADFIERNK